MEDTEQQVRHTLGYLGLTVDEAKEFASNIPFILQLCGEKSEQRRPKTLTARLSLIAIIIAITSSLLGAGLIYVDQWRSYTPTASSTIGTITTLGTVSGRYKRYNNSMTFEASVSITTNGTGSGAVRVTVPDAVAAQVHIANGRETVSTGDQLTGTLAVGTSQCDILKYDNSYPGADGVTLVINGQYEIA